MPACHSAYYLLLVVAYLLAYLLPLLLLLRWISYIMYIHPFIYFSLSLSYLLKWLFRHLDFIFMPQQNSWKIILKLPKQYCYCLLSTSPHHHLDNGGIFFSSSLPHSLSLSCLLILFVSAFFPKSNDVGLLRGNYVGGFCRNCANYNTSLIVSCVSCKITATIYNQEFSSFIFIIIVRFSNISWNDSYNWVMFASKAHTKTFSPAALMIFIRIFLSSVHSSIQFVLSLCRN